MTIPNSRTPRSSRAGLSTGRSPGRTPAGYTRGELDLIQATARARGLSVDICCRVLDDAELPPQQPGTIRPEVAQILRGIHHDADRAGTRPAPDAGHRPAAAALAAPVPAAGQPAEATAARALTAVQLDHATHEVDLARADLALDDTHSDVVAAHLEDGRHA